MVLVKGSGIRRSPKIGRERRTRANVRVSITNQTRGWGLGIAGYGNNMKDAVGVGGARVSTAGNPLGMAGMGSAGANAKKGETGVRSAGGGSASNPLGM